MKVAVVPGDGVGQEVVKAVLPALALLSDRFELGLEWERFDWGAERWLSEGVGLPEGAVDRLAREFDAILFGAVGDPRIPDTAHGREILLGLRTGLDLYVNYRPIVLPGHTIDLYREGTEDLYAGVGGSLGRGSVAEVAVDECIYTGDKVRRFLRHCLAELSARGRRRVTLVHKANAVPNTGRLWRRAFEEELERFPELEGEEALVDSFCYSLVRDPGAFQGVVTSNLFGDIASDVGAALMGGLALAAGASICPETGLGLFEPVHGSAPEIAGKGVANPYGAAMAAALMLDHLGSAEAAAALRGCLEADVEMRAAARPGGGGTTRDFIAGLMAALAGAEMASSDAERQ